MRGAVCVALASIVLVVVPGRGRAQVLQGSLTIAVIGKSEANAIFVAARRGAEAAAQEQSAKLGAPGRVITREIR